MTYVCFCVILTLLKIQNTLIITKSSHLPPSPSILCLINPFCCQIGHFVTLFSSCSSLTSKPFVTSTLFSRWKGIFWMTFYVLPELIFACCHLLLSYSLSCLSNYLQLHEYLKIFISCLHTCMKLFKSIVSVLSLLIPDDSIGWFCLPLWTKLLSFLTLLSDDGLQIGTHNSHLCHKAYWRIFLSTSILYTILYHNIYFLRCLLLRYLHMYRFMYYCHN